MKEKFRASIRKAVQFGPVYTDVSRAFAPPLVGTGDKRPIFIASDGALRPADMNCLDDRHAVAQYLAHAIGLHRG